MARIARSLDVLRDQIDELYPNRSKTSDGWLGDAAHAARKSEHNPNEAGVVTALDITHDPKSGADGKVIAQKLRESKDRRIWYIIFNGKIWNYQSIHDEPPWTARDYTGPNPHRTHVHISTRQDPDLYDSTERWAIDAEVDVPSEDIDFQDITATMFGGDDGLDGKQTAYGKPFDSSKFGVALPCRFKGALPKVKVFYNGKSEIAPVVDVGPWNTNDPYWELKRRPQAETGYDLTGRKTNKAGIDLSVSLAKALGLPGKGLVDWEFVENSPPVVKPTDPVVVSPVPPTPPSLPGAIDWALLERLHAVDWKKYLSDLNDAITSLTKARNMIVTELDTPRAIMKAMQSGKTAGQIVEEREMSMQTNTPPTVEVPTKPALSSKINWVQIASIVSMGVAAFTGVQLELDPQNIAITVATVGGVWNGVTMILRTWFTKSVTVQAVK